LNSLKQEEEQLWEIYLKLVIVWERKDQDEKGSEEGEGGGGRNAGGGVFFGCWANG
jgi:hypothetical protein